MERCVHRAGLFEHNHSRDQELNHNSLIQIQTRIVFDWADRERQLEAIAKRYMLGGYGEGEEGYNKSLADLAWVRAHSSPAAINESIIRALREDPRLSAAARLYARARLRDTLNPPANNVF